MVNRLQYTGRFLPQLNRKWNFVSLAEMLLCGILVVVCLVGVLYVCLLKSKPFICKSIQQLWRWRLSPDCFQVHSLDDLPAAYATHWSIWVCSFVLFVIVLCYVWLKVCLTGMLLSSDILGHPLWFTFSNWVNEPASWLCLLRSAVTQSSQSVKWVGEPHCAAPPLLRAPSWLSMPLPSEAGIQMSCPF